MFRPAPTSKITNYCWSTSPHLDHRHDRGDRGRPDAAAAPRSRWCGQYRYAAIPTGLLVLMDSSKLIGVVTLDSAGHAVFTTSTLAVGLHLIQAAYLGAGGFAASASPTIYELVQ